MLPGKWGEREDKLCGEQYPDQLSGLVTCFIRRSNNFEANSWHIGYRHLRRHLIAFHKRLTMEFGQR